MLILTSYLFSLINILLCFVSIPYHYGLEKPKKWLTKACYATYIVALILGVWNPEKLLHSESSFITLILATIITVVLVVVPLNSKE